MFRNLNVHKVKVLRKHLLKNIKLNNSMIKKNNMKQNKKNYKNKFKDHQVNNKHYNHKK